MGADYYILDPYKPITIRLYCYKCGKEIYLHDSTLPFFGHEKCLEWDSKLPVDMEVSNFEMR
jgi:hypothetical protein